MTAPIQCPSCSAENVATSRFCSSCGHILISVSEMATVPGAAVQAVAAGVGRLVSSDSIPVGGLTPGAILVDRYRIIGLLGRSGMGEVYRADDLKLGQPVALKFLPASLSADPVRRERFFAEVRITRQLAHPNICRVYDIAEVDNQHFLAMEFIDGEDLASLLKRIGHLSNEKALDVARQLVAGLAAAHDRRFGLVALMVASFVQSVMNDFPVTFSSSEWYSGYGYVALGVVAAITFHGFKTSLGGRPLFAGTNLDA